MNMTKLPWIVAGAGVVVLGAVLLVPRAVQATIHPDPRPGITAENVLQPAMVAMGPGTLEAYEAARRVPQVLDGLFCHCNCAKFHGHRSLLTCFESNHGAYCDICMQEAMMAAEMTGSGQSLAQIRKAIDARFRS
jgi:Protein of unknown function with PCYCGC motif